MNTLPYLLPYLLSLILSVGVGIYAWQRRTVVGAVAFTLYALGQASWTLGYIFELLSDDLGSKLFWDDFQYLGTVLVPIAGLVFALQYTGNRWASSRRLLKAIGLVGLLQLALVYTNPLHHGARTNPRIEAAEPFDALFYDFGWVTGVALVCILIFTFWEMGLLLRHAFRTRDLYRLQAVLITLGFGIAVLSFFLPVMGFQFAGQRDISPFVFGIGNLVIAWGLFRYGIFSIVPIARETVVENMKSAVLVLDNTQRLLDANPTAKTFMTSPEFIGKPIETYFPMWQTIAPQFADGQQTHVEIQNGAKFYDTTLSALYDKRGHAVGQLLVLRDVTEQVQARQELHQRSLELEAANQQLQVAWEAAKQADQVKSQFLASMSHELRTPLNAILNFTEFLKMQMFGEVNEKQVDALGKIYGSGKHLLSLINDVLDITKIEAGMMTLFVEEDVNLVAELETVLASTRTLLKDKPVQLVEDMDDDLPKLVGDRRRIRQIMLNLLSNAAKFTEEGTITFSIKKQNNATLLFAVSDTGPGIAQEDQTLIFEPFQQTETGVKQAGGTGLGLPISKRLAEAHGGKLWLESELGAGTTFYVTLPIHSETLLDMIELPETSHA